MAQSDDALPNYPVECRRTLDSGAVLGEPLQVTVLRLNGRLQQQNSRLLSCADWYDTLRARRSGVSK